MIPEQPNSEYLKLLEGLILTILTEAEITIGIASHEEVAHGIISLDEYSNNDFNLHLYCSPDNLFLLGIEIWDDELETSFIPITGDNLNIIPEGLRVLMLKAAQTGDVQNVNISQLRSKS